ncbi:hypothetical protein CEK25_012838 [Fusarium fujikuroi]|nr:hypothetical protein CEK25_012838 [Fusarium fujikuroi]
MYTGLLVSRPEKIVQLVHLTTAQSCISYMSTNEMRQGCKRPHLDDCSRCQISYRLSTNEMPSVPRWTSTFWAAFKGQTDIVEILWRSDQEPVRCDLAGWTPTFWAAFKGQTDIIEMLLNDKAPFRR